MKAKHMLQAIDKIGEVEQRHEPKTIDRYCSIRRRKLCAQKKLKKLPKNRRSSGELADTGK